MCSVGSQRCGSSPPAIPHLSLLLLPDYADMMAKLETAHANMSGAGLDALHDHKAEGERGPLNTNQPITAMWAIALTIALPLPLPLPAAVAAAMQELEMMKKIHAQMDAMHARVCCPSHAHAHTQHTAHSTHTSTSHAQHTVHTHAHTHHTHSTRTRAHTHTSPLTSTYLLLSLLSAHWHTVGLVRM